MRTVSARAAESVPREIVAEVERVFSQCFTLADVLAWTSKQHPRIQVTEIVTQDEYTHDVVLPYGLLYLSFDTT